MDKRVKYGMILLLFLIAGLMLYGYLHRRSAPSPLLTARSSIFVNAGDLVALSNKNESLFNHQYLYKTLSVRGVVRKVKKTGRGTTILLGGPPALPEMVSCSLDTFYRPQPDVRVGDSCTIEGNCAGCLQDIILLDCIIKKQQL